MHDAKTVQRFIELRVQGWVFTQIAQELNVSWNTLIAWSHKPQHTIANLTALSTGRLLTYVESLRRQLRREAGPMQFVAAVEKPPRG